MEIHLRAILASFCPRFDRDVGLWKQLGSDMVREFLEDMIRLNFQFFPLKPHVDAIMACLDAYYERHAPEIPYEDNVHEEHVMALAYWLVEDLDSRVALLSVTS